MAKTTSNNSLLVCLFYLTVCVSFTCSIINDARIYINDEFFKVGMDAHRTFGGRAKYLTYINLNIIWVYFVLSTIYSFYEYINKNKRADKIRNICNSIYVSVGFPVGVLVTSVFWGLYYIDRDLIYPVIIEKVIPRWHNHVNHSLPLFAVLIDVLLTPKSYNKSFFKGFAPTLFLSILYTCWVFIIAYYGGVWVYPFLKVLSNLNRALFFCVQFMFLGMIYYTGRYINNKRWAKQLESRLKKN